jgi:menaquinone-specific isochorismate synthase
MPVTEHCNQLFQNRKDLYHFLVTCQQNAIIRKRFQIASLSLEISAVDPLTVLNQLAQKNQRSFYFEKQDVLTESHFISGRIAVAGIGSAVDHKVEGRDRFSQAKSFIEQTISNSFVAGDRSLPFAGAHFFCSFAFADTSIQEQFDNFSAATVCLPKWQIAYQKNRSTLVANFKIDAATDLEPMVDSVLQMVQAVQSIHYEVFNPSLHHLGLVKYHPVAPVEHFKHSVQSALVDIQKNTFNKIVLAHALDVLSPLPFHPFYSLNNLRKLYPDCYIFALSDLQGQHFIGASPERLASLHNQQLVTDALAGSAPRGRDAYDDARFANTLLNSAKEIHEHQVVVDFIAAQLARLGLVPRRSPLRLLQLSNIQHLHTPMSAAVPTGVHLLDILAALHPTPAVAGMPRETTRHHIQRYEPFARSLYAAPIGWVNDRGEGEFAVGIRSAILQGNQARIFAGAGIVAGSDPARELAEVQLKMQALLSALST